MVGLRRPPILLNRLKPRSASKSAISRLIRRLSDMHFSRGTDTGAGHYQASESFDLAETDHRSRRPY